MCASTSPSEESQLNFDCFYIYSKKAIKTHSKPHLPNWEDKFIYLKNRWSSHFKTVLNKPKIKYWDVAVEKYRSKYKNTNECKSSRIKETEQICTFQEIRRSHSSNFSPNDQQTEFLDYSPISNKKFKYCKQSSCSSSKSPEQRKKYNPYDIGNKNIEKIKKVYEENSNAAMKNFRKSNKYWNTFDSSYSSPSGCCSRTTHSASDTSERSFQYNPDKNIRHLQKSTQGQNTSQTSCYVPKRSCTDCNSAMCSCRSSLKSTNCKSTNSSEVCVRFKTIPCDTDRPGQYSRNSAGGVTKPASTSQYSNDSGGSQYHPKSFRSQYDNRKTEPSKVSYVTDTEESIYTDRKSGQPFTTKTLDNNRRSEQLDTKHSTSTRNNHKSGPSKVSPYSTDSYSNSSISNDGSRTSTYAKMSRNSKDSRYVTDDDRKSKQLKTCTPERVRSCSTPDSCTSSESCDSEECVKSFITFEQVCSCLDKLNRKCGERSPKCCGKDIPKCKCKTNPARKIIVRKCGEYDCEYIQDQSRKENSRSCNRSSNIKKCYSPPIRDTCIKYTYCGSDTSNASSESCPSECERSFITFQKVCTCLDKCCTPEKPKKCSSPRKPQCTISTQSSCERTVTYLKPNCRSEVEFIPVNKSRISQDSEDCNDFYSTPSTSLEFNIRCAKALSECNKNSSTNCKPSSIACSEPQKPKCKPTTSFKNIKCVPSKPKCSRQDEIKLNCISSSLKCCARMGEKQSLHSCTSSGQSLRSCASSANQNQVKFKPSRTKCEGISNRPSCKSSRSSCCERMNNHPSCKSSNSNCCRRMNHPSCEPSRESCCNRGRHELSYGCPCMKPRNCGRRKCPFNQDSVCISKHGKCSSRPSCKPRKCTRPRICDYSPSISSVCIKHHPRHCIEPTYQSKNCITSDYDSSSNICCGRKKCPFLRNMKHNSCKKYQKNSESSIYKNDEFDYVEVNKEPRSFFRPEEENNNRKKKSKSTVKSQDSKENLVRCTESTCKSLKDELIHIKKNLKCVKSTTKEDQECSVKCCSSCTCCEEEPKNLQFCDTTPENLNSCTGRTTLKAQEILKKFRDLINPSKNKPPTPLCLHSSKSEPELNDGVCLCTSSKINGNSLCPNLISELSVEKVSSDLLSNFTILDRCCSKPNCPYWQDKVPDSPAAKPKNCKCNEQNTKLNFSVYTHVQNSLLNNTISFPRSEEMCDKKSCPMKKEPIFIISTSEPSSSSKIKRGKNVRSCCKNKEPLATLLNSEPVGRTKIQRNEKDTLTDKDKEECSCTRQLYKGEVIVYSSSINKNEPKLKKNKIRKLFRCANATNRANSVPLCQKPRTTAICNKSVHFSRKNLVHCIPANDDSKSVCYVVSAGNESEKVRRISNSSKSFNLLSHCKDLLFPQKNTAAAAIAPRRRWLKDMIEAIPSKMYGDIPDLQFKFVAPLCSKKYHVIKMKNLCNL